MNLFLPKTWAGLFLPAPKSPAPSLRLSGRFFLFIFILSCLVNTLSAQYVYTIKADSVKLTNCDSTELIIENHAQSVPGFLFNTGNGRTIFKRGVLKLNDSLYLIGGDTLKQQSRSWVQGGNKFDTTGILGTLDNNHLEFYTNNIRRGRWTNTGNLLIGTAIDNGYMLDVAGSVRMQNSLNLVSTVPGNSGNFIISPKLQVTGTSFFSSNIGVGTFTPTAQFHTTGSVRFAGLTSDTTKTRVVVSDANGNLYYRDASTLAINGILNASLAINGTIFAQRLKLSQTGWPDYVFDSSYRLPSLKELEDYIQKNQHLPGITSAKEVTQAGIDIGDNQAALLKKIEELTLYSIEQDKKLQIQNEKIGEIKNLEDTLKQQNAELETLKLEMAELRKLIEYKSDK